MNRTLKKIVCSALAAGIIILIALLYYVSAVLHSFPARTALIIGAIFTITDGLAAIFIFLMPEKSDE